jgi:transposase-like protein
MPPSRTVAPYSPSRTPLAARKVSRHGRHLPPFIPDTNPLERFNREIGRRTDVVGIFPDDPSLIRLVSMLAIEANDEWLVGRSYISQKSMATLYASRSENTLPPKTEEEVGELIAA